MTIFIDSEFNRGVRLNITGEKPELFTEQRQTRLAVSC